MPIVYLLLSCLCLLMAVSLHTSVLQTNSKQITVHFCFLLFFNPTPLLTLLFRSFIYHDIFHTSVTEGTRKCLLSTAVENNIFRIDSVT